MLTFEESDHTYRWNGDLVPSVTQILRDMGLVDTTHLAESGRIRGAIVAMATEMVDRGQDVNYGTYANLVPAEDLQGYVLAWLAWKRAARFKVTHIEERVYNDVHRYAGTLDRRGLLAGDVKAVVDIKTGAAMPAYPLQTAAYAASLIEHHRRFAVTLRSDGTFRVAEHQDRTDLSHFRAAASLWHWKQEHGLNGHASDSGA